MTEQYESLVKEIEEKQILMDKEVLQKNENVASLKEQVKKTILDRKEDITKQHDVLVQAIGIKTEEEKNLV